MSSTTRNSAMQNMTKSNLIVTVILVILIIMGIYLFIKKKRDNDRHRKKSSNKSSKSEDNKDKKDADKKFETRSAKINNPNNADNANNPNNANNANNANNLKPPMLQKPYNVTAELINISTVRLNWNMAKSPSSDPTFDSLPIEYAVYRYKNPAQTPETHGEMKPETIEIAPSTEYIFTDLDPLSEPIQYFRIRAANSRTISDFSDVIKIELNCGLDFNDTNENTNLKEIAAKVDPVYDRQTNVLTWNRILGVSGYGIFVIADKYHQQFYVAERNGEVSGFKGLDPSNTKIATNPVKVLDLSNIGAINIKGILIYLVNHCGASTMLIAR